MNLFLTFFKYIENKIIHVIVPCIEVHPTRHLDQRGEISTIACSQAIVSPVKDSYNNHQSSDKSLNLGFTDLIKANFLSLFHFFNCFSRAIASKAYSVVS